MVLASYLVNLYDEDLSSNMESDTEVNMCDFFRLVVMRNSHTVVVMTFYFVFFSLVRIDNLVLV